MKATVLVAFVAALLTSLAFCQKMPWAKDYKSALAAASGAKKLVMLDFYTDW